MKRSALLRFALLAAICAPIVSEAHFRIELNDGGVVIADSYREEGGKVIVNRPSGSLEFPRASVKAITEREGSAPGEAASAPSARSERPADGAAAAPAAPAVSGNVFDLQQRERAIVQELIQKHNGLAFAKARHAPADEIASRKKEIDALNQERRAVRKQLGLPSGEEQASASH